MNIFLREMKANRKALIVWCIGMFLLIASSMAKFAGLSASGQSINDLIAKMPTSLKALYGVGTFDISTASGYYGLLFLYLVLIATIHAAMLGANIISKEERDKTAEFLFVKPVSRNKIITSKIVAALLNLLIFNIVTLISSIVMVGKYSKGEDVNGDILILMVGLFVLQLIFLFIGSGIAALTKKPKTAGSLATGILLLTFILSIIIDINEKLESLKYLTPFKYYEAKHLMFGSGFDAVYVILSGIIIVLTLLATYVFYKKKDLNI